LMTFESFKLTNLMTAGMNDGWSKLFH
jgi:hypothetical protein